MSRNLFVPALLFLATPAAAEVTFFVGRTIGEDHIPPLPGAMKRTISGEMTGNCRKDVVMMVGSRPVWLFDPGIYEAFLNCPETGYDIATAHGRAPNGRDAVALVSVRGLELWWLDLQARALASRSVGTPILWAGCSRVECGDVAGNGEDGVVGLLATGLGFMMLPDPDEPQSESFLLITDYVVHDFRLAEWDGEPGVELACTTSEGFKLLRQDGSEILGYPYGDDGDFLCVFHEPGIPTDQIALVVEIGTAHSIFALSPGVVEPAVFLGDIDLVAVVSGDFDKDGYDDLVISQRNTKELLYFQNQAVGHSQAFAWNDGYWDLIDLTSDGTGSQPAPENQATPALVDLDGDGDGDILHPLESEELVVICRSETFDHVLEVPQVVDGDFVYDDDTDSGTLTLTFAAPVEDPRESEGFEVVVWYRADVDTGTYEVAVWRDVIELPDPETEPSPWPLEVSLPIDEIQPSIALFSVQVRIVDLDEARENVIAAAPTCVWAFSTAQESLEGIADMYGVSYEEILDFGDPEPPGGPGMDADTDAAASGSGGTAGSDDGAASAPSDDGGGAVPLPCVPCFTDDKYPDEYGDV